MECNSLSREYYILLRIVVSWSCSSSMARVVRIVLWLIPFIHIQLSSTYSCSFLIVVVTRRTVVVVENKRHCRWCTRCGRRRIFFSFHCCCYFCAGGQSLPIKSGNGGCWWVTRVLCCMCCCCCCCLVCRQCGCDRSFVFVLFFFFVRPRYVGIITDLSHSYDTVAGSMGTMSVETSSTMTVQRPYSCCL